MIKLIFASVVAISVVSLSVIVKKRHESHSEYKYWSEDGKISWFPSALGFSGILVFFEIVVYLYFKNGGL